MKGISDDHVKQWYSAQGLSDQDVSALRSAAFRSGLPNPTGSFATNAVQYIAAPFVTLAAGTPWAGTGVGIATMLATPAANAFQQSAVVALGESIREHGGPVIANSKDSINDKHWLPELSKDLQQQVDQFSALHSEVSNTLSRLGLASAGYTEATLKPLLEALPPSDLQELQQQGERLLNAETKLHETQRNFLMTQGAHERQWSGNKWQAIPRTLRAPIAGFTGLVSKTGPSPSEAESPASAPAPGPAAVATAAAGLAAKVLSPTMQTVAAVVMTVGQHVAAGFDEKAKQEYNNKLNLLYGDLFTDGGKEKLARGEPLNGDDIDAKKLRGFTQSREQSLVKHVSAELGRQIKTIDSQLNPPADKPSKPLSTEARAALQEQLATLTADAGKLKAGQLSELSSGGMAETLLIASDKSVLSQQLLQDVKAKYTMKEFSSQTIQRAGQAFHLGVLGSAASSVIGKVVSAASGGTRNAPTGQTAGIAVLSGGMAFVGAKNQHTAISVKNNRRESDANISAWTQFKRGVGGGAIEYFAQRSGEKASRDMNEKLGQDATGATLQFAKAVQGHFGSVPLPENTAHVMSLDEAAQQLHPGHATPAGAGHVAIDMESLSPKKSDPAQSSSAGQERPVRDQPAASDKGKAPMVDDGKSA
jgi:biotin carboxyl carrier protein